MRLYPIDELEPEVQKEILRASKKDGIGYGVFLEDGKQVFVTVTFYPKRKWWIYRGDVKSPLTLEIYRRLTRLKL